MNFLWSLLFFCAAVRVSHGTEQRELLTLMMPEVGPEGVKSVSQDSGMQVVWKDSCKLLYSSGKAELRFLYTWRMPPPEYLSSPSGLHAYYHDIIERAHNDYMCRSVQLQPADTYIVQFEPRADPRVAHHMLLFGCPSQPNPRQSWSCKSSALVCGWSQRSHILFAWALNASGLHLPDGVGLEIGPSHKTNYAVLQVHYGHPEAVPPEAVMGEHEALVLHLTQKKQPFIAGVYILGSMSTITAGKEAAYVDTACMFAGPNPINPIAFRTHAHSLGKVIAGYVVKNNNEDWELIGSRSPQDAQAFYPAVNSVVVNPGDWLAARCVFNTQAKTHSVHMGANSEDEMCNFYIMYYMVNNGRNLVDDGCWNGPPSTFHFPELHIPEPVPSDGMETEAHHTHSHTEHGGGNVSETSINNIVTAIHDIMDEIGGDGESPTTEATPPTVATNEHQNEQEEDDYICPNPIPPGSPSICPKPKPIIPTTNTPTVRGPTTETIPQAQATAHPTQPTATTAAVSPQATEIADTANTTATTQPVYSSITMATDMPDGTHSQEEAGEDQSPSANVPSLPPTSTVNTTESQSHTVSTTSPTEIASQPGTPFSQQNSETEQNQDHNETSLQEDKNSTVGAITHASNSSSPPSDSKTPVYKYGIVAAMVVIVIAITLLIIGIFYDQRCRWYVLSLCKRRSDSYEQVSADKSHRPRDALHSLMGPGKQGFSKLRTSDSDSEVDEFPIFSRV